MTLSFTMIVAKISSIASGVGEHLQVSGLTRPELAAMPSARARNASFKRVSVT